MAFVMVIEDNPVIGFVIEEALMEEGHQVDLYSSAREGLVNMQEGRLPEIVLTDLQLPGMSGRELITKMRDNQRLQEIPIIIITGSVPNPEIFPSSDLYQGLLIKPFDLDDLITAVTDHTACLSE